MLLSINKLFSKLYLTRNLLQSTRVVIAANKYTRTHIELPDKPSRPLTPFFEFLKEWRPKLIGASDHLRQTGAISRKVGIMWNNLDDSEKAKYGEGYSDKMADYQRQLKLYKEKLTSEQQTELLRIKEKGNKEKNRKERRRQGVELGKPKKFSTAFFLYKIDQQKPETVLSKEWASECAKKWESLNEHDKKPYIEESGKQKADYMKQLDEWEKRMMADGNYLVIRKTTINKSRPKKTKQKSLDFD